MPTKICIVEALLFPGFMYRSESWTIKKAEHEKNWVFQIKVPKRTLESTLESKEIKPVDPKGNQSWIFTGRTDAEAPIFDWCEELTHSLILGKIEGRRRRGQQRMIWLDGISSSMDMSLNKLWEIGKDREAWHASVHGVAKTLTWQWLNNSRRLKSYLGYKIYRTLGLIDDTECGIEGIF